MTTTVVTQIRRLVPSCSEINDPFEMSHYWSTMLRYWKLPAHIQHFPGANPMSIEERDFERLQTDDFLAALKTDGVRHLLMLTYKPNSTDPIAIMIDRTKRMYEIEIWANEDFFSSGSLFDGELVWENASLVYIAFDVIHAKGVQCSRLSYRERMQILHNTILCVSNSHSDESIENMISEESKFLARNNDNDLRVVPKKCVPKANLKTLWHDRVHACHGNDGIIFTLNNAPVETGTCPSILKWKSSHSIDVLVRHDEHDGLRLFGNMNNSSDLSDVTRRIGDLSIRFAHNNLVKAVRPRMPCILECRLGIEGDTLTLTPERERSDKSSPNTMNTIEATIRNTRENISIDDLIQLVHSTF